MYEVLYFIYGCIRLSTMKVMTKKNERLAFLDRQKVEKPGLQAKLDELNDHKKDQENIK